MKVEGVEKFSTPFFVRDAYTEAVRPSPSVVQADAIRVKALEGAEG